MLETIFESFKTFKLFTSVDRAPMDNALYNKIDPQFRVMAIDKWE